MGKEAKIKAAVKALRASTSPNDRFPIAGFTVRNLIRIFDRAYAGKPAGAERE